MNQWIRYRQKNTKSGSVSERMNQSVGEWMNQWVSYKQKNTKSGSVSERINQSMNEWISESVTDRTPPNRRAWVNKLISRWMNESTAKSMCEWINEWISESESFFFIGNVKCTYRRCGNSIYKVPLFLWLNRVGAGLAWSVRSWWCFLASVTRGLRRGIVWRSLSVRPRQNWPVWEQRFTQKRCGIWPEPIWTTWPSGWAFATNDPSHVFLAEQNFALLGRHFVHLSKNILYSRPVQRAQKKVMCYLYWISLLM